MEVTITVRPLAELEATIERGLTTFVEVGQALLEIREHRLYRESHDSFEVYCRERWGWSARHVTRQIEAAGVAAAIGPMGPIPANERQARELAPLLDQPEMLREVWSEVTEEHGGKQTATHVHDAASRRLAPTRRAPDPDFADDYVDDVPARPIDEPIEDVDGQAYETLPLSDDDIRALPSLDPTPEDVAHSALVRLIGVQRLDPAAVADCAQNPGMEVEYFTAIATWVQAVADALRSRVTQPIRAVR